MAKRGKAKPNHIDQHVGARVRLRRTLLGMSQERLGEALGLTFQQVQKYERGINRIGASRLFDLSRVLAVPIAFFFDGLNDGGARRAGVQNLAPASLASLEPDALDKRETLEFVGAFCRIDDLEVRRCLLGLVKAIAAAPAGGS